MEKVHGWKLVPSEEQQSREDAVGDQDSHVEELEETVNSMPVSPSSSVAGDSIFPNEDSNGSHLPANDLELFDSPQPKQDTTSELPGPRDISEVSKYINPPAGRGKPLPQPRDTWAD